MILNRINITYKTTALYANYPCMRLSIYIHDYNSHTLCMFRLGYEINAQQYKTYELDRPDLISGTTFYVSASAWKTTTYKNNWFYHIPIEKAYFKACLSTCQVSAKNKWTLEYEAFNADGEPVTEAFITKHCRESLPDGGKLITKEDYETIELNMKAS
jgi:hypothetical protein